MEEVASSCAWSYSRLLLQCAQHKDVLKGRRLHAQIIIHAAFLPSHVFLSNTLVNMYAKCGNLSEARLVFEEIPNKDVVSWNCIINGYSQHSPHLSSALELFQRMRREGVFPNPFTFAGVFTAASNLSSLDQGKQLHSLSIKTSDSSDVFVATSLVNMYSKLASVSDARQVFDRMPHRNSVSWAAMISGYAIQRCQYEALELFKSMLKSDMGLNEFVFTAVLSALAAPESLANGRQIHGLALKTGFQSFVSVGNSLVTMYAKCESLDDALRTFETSADKNSITWSAMITGFAQNGNSGESLRLFSEMQLAGLRPSEFTLVGVLNSCSNQATLCQGKQVHDYLIKLGFQWQIFIRTALVDMYAKCGSIEDARKEFDHLQEPDIVLWTSMIGGYVQNGEDEEALVLYGRMEMERILPNALTMASVLKACSSLAALEQGKQVHARTIKYGLGLGLPIGSSLSTMYAKCGNLEDGNLVFKRTPNRDVISWNSMISGFSQNGRGNEALQLFEEMQLEGTEPDSVTFVNLLFACSHMGMVQKGWHYFNSMHQSHGIIPRLEHYACMVDILGRAGDLDKAKDFIESVPIDHGMCLWRILLGACRKFGNFDLGAFAGERLVELGSLDSSAYVLLSNIYSAMGRWKDVERVRSRMKCLGVNKEPGCSWIELRNRVHVFVVKDLLHPQIKEIYVQLRSLTNQMRDEGYEPNLRLYFPNSEHDIRVTD